MPKCIPDARVVDDGDVLTAGGVTSAVVHLVRRERGAMAARLAAKRIEHSRRDRSSKCCPSREALMTGLCFETMARD